MLLVLLLRLLRTKLFLTRLFRLPLLFAVVVLLLFEIVARYVFSSPTIWASELTQMVFGAYIILSGGFLLVRNGHINVDIFYDRLGERGKAVVNIATCFLFFAFLAVILKEGWVMAEDSWSMGETSFSAWNPVLWPLKMAIPAGALLLLLQGVVSLVGDVLVLTGRKDLARRIEAEGVAHDA